MTMTPVLDDARSFGSFHDARSDTEMVCHSRALGDALARAKRVAPTDATVLVTGETGTGKELLARCLHSWSRRAKHQLVAVNLAAIPEALIASELFGHEQGAFTGASQRRIGRFEFADRGTLFLDEVSELSHEMQVSLLRVVQEGEFELGASQTRRVDVRLIAATNQNLEQAVEIDRFRADLYYRLSVFPIQLPPLRERREDILPLAEHFLHQLVTPLGRKFFGIDPESAKRLRAFKWPGNIRQLQNIIEHSAILCDEAVLHVPEALIAEKPSGLKSTSSLGIAVDGHEKRLIEQALQDSRGRVSGPSGAAVRLGLPASTLESKIKRFNIVKLQRFGGRS